jgi:hypothetical protein
MAKTRDGTALTAYYFLLDPVLRGEIELFARCCAPGTCAVDWHESGAVVIAFSEADDALLFMNLYDGQIREEFKILSEDDIAAAA